MLDSVAWVQSITALPLAVVTSRAEKLMAVAEEMAPQPLGGSGARLFAQVDELRQRDRGQDAEDHDDHDQLDERKTLLLHFNISNG
jgi:hypothetical protein